MILSFILTSMILYIGTGLLMTIIMAHFNFEIGSFTPREDSAFFILLWPIILYVSGIHFLVDGLKHTNRFFNKVVHFFTSR